MSAPDFSRAAGEVLRRTRHTVGLTLHQVMVRSRGTFKPSVVGDYERGERRISLERFWQLAMLYGVPADRLLAQILDDLNPPRRTEVVVDVSRLKHVASEEGLALAEFVHRVKAQRGDYLAERITLRAGDIEAICLSLRRSPQSFLAKIGPALAPERDPEGQAEGASSTV